MLLLTSHYTKAGMGHVQKGINTHRMRKTDAIDCPAVLHYYLIPYYPGRGGQPQPLQEGCAGGISN